MNRHSKATLVLLFLTGGLTGHAQQTKLDSLANDVAKIKKQMSLLSNLKISGYVQAQYQYADTMGAKTFNGGNFGSTLDNRFMVRRARLKTAYEMPFGSAVVQIDATEKGVSVKNAYVNLIAPFAKSLSITGGIFDRPFGYAVSYSSSSMEVVERPIIIQTLFPGEQDLGAAISYKAAQTSLFRGLSVTAGLFNGNGINPEIDKFKDLIGRIAYDGFGFGSNVYLNVGSSLYLGHVFNPTSTPYEMKNVNGVEVFHATLDDRGAKLLRRYVGFDGEFSVNTPIGKTQLVSEYIWGKQPGLTNSSISPNYASIPTTSEYLRDFRGGYVTLIQNIKKFALYGRYDCYDPNIKVSGNDVGKTVTAVDVKPTNATDLKIWTTSIGTFYEPVKNIRFTAQYDFNRYEKTDNGQFMVDGLKNNLFTFRIQYKF